MIAGIDIDAFVEATLAEDLGGAADAARDLTGMACLAPGARLKAILDSRDAVVVAGLPLAAAFFRRLDPDCSLQFLVADGDAV
ncbi:MAG: carboxylating nicotinate-nucleotide diphosphorylase, partial [Sandaracinobacteroides sp.]